LQESVCLGCQPLEAVIAVEEGLLEFARQLAQRGLGIDLIALRQLLDGPLVKALARLRPAPPGLHPATVQALVRIGNDELRIGHQARSQAVAGRTGPGVAVEGKVLWRQL